MEALVLLAIGVMVVGFSLVLSTLYRRRDDTALGLIKQDLQGLQDHFGRRLDSAAQAFAGLQGELGKMQELGRSLRDVQDMLKSPKLRGNIGEQLMADLIKQQIPKANYQLQHAFRSGDKVDAVIKTKSGLIPVDSKFPSENFAKYLNVRNEEEKARAYKEFQTDVKKHIKAIAKKYIIPAEGTVDFALMYVPGEAVYYEIITNTNLSEYGASQRVYLVSPHSFYYFLQTVLLGLEGELIEAKAKDVMNYLKTIRSDASNFSEYLILVDKHLTNAKKASDTAISKYTKLSDKIDSANRLSGEAAEKINPPDPESLAEAVEEEAEE